MVRRLVDTDDFLGTKYNKTSKRVQMRKRSALPLRLLRRSNGPTLSVAPGRVHLPTVWKNVTILDVGTDHSEVRRSGERTTHSVRLPADLFLWGKP